MTAPLLLATANGASVYHCDWRALVHVVSGLGGCDALIVDAPYSQRTHAGHDVVQGFEKSAGRYQKADRTWRDQLGERRVLTYSYWTPADVAAFVGAWSPRVNGWFVSITDHELARAWEGELQRAGRYVFAPLPYVATGSRVRLAGDGPSNWTCWIIVARPRSREFAKWGTLPGAYVLPQGEGGAMPVVGGKPLWLLRRLCEDYSRPNGLVVDPCCGSGSLAVAAIQTGRRSIVGDVKSEHVEIAARWIKEPGRRCPTEQDSRQVLLFDGESQAK